jgi:hypothetical protein
VSTCAFSDARYRTVRGAHHGDLDALVAQAGDAPCPLALDQGSPFELEAEFAEELDRHDEVFDDDADVVQSESHLASLGNLQGVPSAG